MHANSQSTSDTRSSCPRWVVGVLILQCAMLLFALRALPGASAVEANHRTGSLPAQDDRESVLPNPAAQRAEQIRLLKQIAGEMSEMNAGLKKLNDNLAKNQE